MLPARRAFLIRTGLTFAAGVLAGAPAPTQPVLAQQDLPSGDSWDAVRQLFNLDWSYIHLGGLLLASHPRPVREAIERHRPALEALAEALLERETLEGAEAIAILHTHGITTEDPLRRRAADDRLRGSRRPGTVRRGADVV